MSIDFDSAALQTQHEEEEYDQEDYAREQEVRFPLSVRCNNICGRLTFKMIWLWHTAALELK